MAYAERTDVALDKSIAEIIDMIRKAGAESIGQMQDPDKITIAFALADRRIKFVIPMVTEYGGPKRHPNGKPIREQAWIDQKNRQKGRALMLVIKAKLESVESGVETFEEAFLANVIMSDGRTLYERVREPIAIEYQTGKVAPLQLAGPSN